MLTVVPSSDAGSGRLAAATVFREKPVPKMAIIVPGPSDACPNEAPFTTALTCGAAIADAGSHNGSSASVRAIQEPWLRIIIPQGRVNECRHAKHPHQSDAAIRIVSASLTILPEEEPGPKGRKGPLCTLAWSLWVRHPSGRAWHGLPNALTRQK